MKPNPLLGQITAFDGVTPREGYTRPSYVDVGSVVLVPHPLPGKPNTALRVVVTIAAGMHARVENELHGVSRWVSLYDMVVPVGDPLAPT